jgi:translation initiation factor 2 subunit 3
MTDNTDTTDTTDNINDTNDGEPIIVNYSDIIKNQPTINIGTLGSVGDGKCLKKGTNVTMYSGDIVPVETIKQGDLLMGDDSTPRKVTQTTNGVGKLYKIGTDTAHYVVNDKHILSLKNCNETCKIKKHYKLYRVTWYENWKLCVKEFPITDGDITKTKAQAVEFQRELLSHPINKQFDVIDINVEQALQLDRDQYKGFRTNVDFPTKDILGDPYDHGYNLKMSNTYIRNSFSVRYELLAGVIDKWGQKDGRSYILHHKNKSLIDKLNYLCRSLGLQTQVQQCSNKVNTVEVNDIVISELEEVSADPTRYKMTITGSNLEKLPLKLSWKKMKPATYNNQENMYTIQIEEDGVGEFYGFELDGNSRFLLGDFTVTHNSTLTHRLTGIRTQKHTKELENNCTIHIGYANTKIYKNNKTGEISTNPPVEELDTLDSNMAPSSRNKFSDNWVLKKHISIPDVPGHESYMSNMMAGMKVMDGVVGVIAANSERVPLPQTYEHLLVMSQTNIKESNILIVHNKLDIVSEEKCLQHYEKMKKYLQTTKAANSQIIPISAQLQYNMDKVLEYIIHNISDKSRDITSPGQMIIIRSFDVNKPTNNIKNIKGGVLGGSIRRGVFSLDDVIEIKPGLMVNKDGVMYAIPLITTIKTLFSEKTPLDYAIPGGLIAIGTDLDTVLSKSDNLVGNLVGHIGTLPDLFSEIVIKYKNIDRPNIKTKAIKKGEELVLSINSRMMKGVVTESKGNKIKVKLDLPLCCDEDEEVGILRLIERKWKLASHGNIRGGLVFENVVYPKEYNNLKTFERKQYKINYDVNEDDDPVTMDYHKLLKNITFYQNKKISIMPPKSKPVNRDTVIQNFGQLCDSIGANTTDINMLDHVTHFIKSELQTTCNLNEGRQLVIKGRYYEKQINNVYMRYIMKYIRCDNCFNVNTSLSKKNKILFKCCGECQSDIAV